MTKQNRFTKEFEDEAVRLVGTSGRTKRQIEDDLGVGANVRRRLRGLSGKLPHLIGNDCKAPAGVSCACGLDGGVDASLFERDAMVAILVARCDQVRGLKTARHGSRNRLR